MTAPSTIENHIPVGIMNLAYACRQTVGTAVLRYCNIFGRSHRWNWSKALPTKIHLTVDKFKIISVCNFSSALCIPAATLRFVLHLSFWICGRCVLCVWPESQITILFGRFIWLFRISIQLLLNWSVSSSCKISVFSVAMSFSVNYFLWEFIKYWENDDVKHPSGFQKL